MVIVVFVNLKYRLKDLNLSTIWEAQFGFKN